MTDPDRYCTAGCRRHTIAWWALIPDHDDAPDMDLMLCAVHSVHSDQHADALTRDGWVKVADEREPLKVTPITTGGAA